MIRAAATVIPIGGSDVGGDPWIGRTVGGRYTIRRLIGRGGIGLVYRASRPAGADVVIKALAPNWVSDDEAVARFDREATRLGQVRHPNIVSMLDHGRAEGQAYLVMEYLHGVLLSSYLEERGRLTLKEFVPIAAQILKGIGHAHSRELMVRDIKPGNIMLCERMGRANFVKILDFGLAKLIAGDEQITRDQVLGTVGYLAPETIRGTAIDLRVDVYALGVLFYEMLAGKPPFEALDRAALLYATVNDAPPDLRSLLGTDSDVPEGLVALIHRCLEKDPAARPADATALVEELIDCVPASYFRLPRVGGSTSDVASSDSQQSIVRLVPRTEPQTSPPSAPRASERSGLRIAAASLVAGALLVVAGGALGMGIWGEAGEAAPPAPVAATPAVVPPPVEPEAIAPAPVAERDDPAPTIDPPAVAETPAVVEEPPALEEPPRTPVAGTEAAAVAPSRAPRKRTRRSRGGASVETAAAAPAPVPARPRAEEQKKRVFLPTKKSAGSGGVFLPTKE